jgi:hypothetical protein
MADNSTYITGVAQGAFAEAYDGLPPWATEKTAMQIEKYLRKSLDIHSKTLLQLMKSAGAKGQSLTPEEMKKVSNELDKLSKNLKRTNEEDEKAKKRGKQRENAEKDSLTRGRKLKTSEDKLNYALTGLAAAGTKIIGVNKEYIDVYDSLFQSGINVLNGNNSTADGFEALNQIVNLTGLRLETLQKVVEKYSSAVNVVGLTKFSKTLAMTNSQLVALGYSSEAQTELIGVLIEAESGYMNIRGKTAAQIASDAIRLGGQLTKLSHTVGLSREQLQENLKANSKSIQSAMVFASMGKKAADTFNLNAAGIKDSGLKETLTKLAVAANPAQVKEYNDLVAAGAGAQAEQMNRLAQAMKTDDVDVFQQRIKSLGESFQAQPGVMNSFRNLIGAGGEEAATALNGLMQQANAVTDATQKQAAAAVKTQASIAGIQTELESLAATLQKAFFPTVEQVNLLTSGLKQLNGVINGMIGSIEAQTRSWIGIGIAVAGLVASLFIGKKGIDTFFSLFSSNASKGTSILTKAANGISKGASAIGSGIMKGGAAIMNAFASVGKGIVQGASSLGSWFMKAGPAVMNGIGKGFQSLMPILSKVGGFLVRLLGPIGWLYTAFQLGSALGEKLYDAIGSAQWFTDAVDGLAGWIKGAGRWISEAGESIYLKIQNVGQLFKDIFDIFIGNIKRSGQMLMDMFPWLKEAVNVISTGVNWIRNIFKEIMISLKNVLGDILVNFGHKMTFGVFKDEPAKAGNTQKPEVKTDAQRPAPQISIPKTPAASTVASPSAVAAEAPPPGKSTDVPAATTTTTAAATKPATKTGDINSLLANQGLLLEQILDGTNTLVSVNKDILKYARNAA